MCSALSVINTYYEVAYQLLFRRAGFDEQSDSVETWEGIWKKNTRGKGNGPKRRLSQKPKCAKLKNCRLGSAFPMWLYMART